MAWRDDVLVDGFDVLLYCQAAGTSAEPDTDDEVPYGTAFSWTTEKEKTERGPHINSSAKKVTQGGISKSGELSIDQHKATNTVRGLLIAAGTGTSRVKLTLFVGGASGDKRVWDNVIVDEGGEVDPAAGVSLSFPWTADSYAYTAGTYA